MSSSALIFRLEIADHSPLPSLYYSSKYEPLSPKDKLSYSDALVGNFTHKKLKLETYRGKRQLQPISIETFAMEANLEHTGMNPKKLTLDSRSNSNEARSSNERTWDKCDDTQHGAANITDIKTQSQMIEEQIKGAIGIGCETKPSGSRPSSAKQKSVGYKSSSRGTTPIPFSSGNPSVENAEGIVHIYKESATQSNPRTSEMLCMLMVPSTMTSQDFLQFVSPVESWLEHIKIVRDNSPNTYMVLLKFRNQGHTDDFYKNFNNQPFNSIEPEVCHLVYVSHLESVKETEGGGIPLQGLTELPTCPVCLERMDESVDGILTVLCNHSFHTSCLSQWVDTSCPVCRYVQTPEHTADNKCFQCSNNESLWICLICGHVGCGRYASGHAHNHFEETQHTYSMQLGSQRVWDYAGDNYVHRLVQSKEDGKLVEVGDHNGSNREDKLDSITLEYTYLLTSQLEAQRLFYEERIEHIEKQALKQVSDAESQSKAVLDQCSKLENALQKTTKRSVMYEKKANELQARIDELSQAVEDESEISKSLVTNQEGWQHKIVGLDGKLDDKNREITDLKEQLRDIMFYMEAQQKLSETTLCSQEELQEGQVIVDGATGQTRASSGRKGRRKK